MATKKEQKARPLWDPQIVSDAIGDALVKLHPRTMVKNPVMFVVEVGSVVTTALLFTKGGRQDFAFGPIYVRSPEEKP